jgi:hypothetical protein
LRHGGGSKQQHDDEFRDNRLQRFHHPEPPPEFYPDRRAVRNC